MQQISIQLHTRNYLLNYKQQLAVVEGLSLQPDIQTRMDCPFCNGRNTFSVDTTEGNINWYCFHASCSAKGKKQGEKKYAICRKSISW